MFCTCITTPVLDRGQGIPHPAVKRLGFGTHVQKGLEANLILNGKLYNKNVH